MSAIKANKRLNERLSTSTRKSVLLDRNESDISRNDSLSLFDEPIGIDRQARFEEWIKLTTDNKINSTNSWAVALIDYFHDMDIFREGDNINFAKASTTLDGCVKVYSSRVESVISETGKLLNGLSTKNRDDSEEDDEDDDNENINVNQEGDENGESRRKNTRINTTTLKKWKEIKMRSLDEELSIDPLFKKTLAEFDEGGAKSLLLNMLFVDKDVKIMFDTTSSGFVEEELEYKLNLKNEEGEGEVEDGGDDDVYKDKLKNAQIPFNDNIDVSNFKYSLLTDDFKDLHVCTFTHELLAVVNDIEKAKTVLKEVTHDNSYSASFSAATHNKGDDGDDGDGDDDEGADFGGGGGGFNDFGGSNDNIGSLDHQAQEVLFNDDFEESKPHGENNRNEMDAIFDDSANSSTNKEDGFEVEQTEMDSDILGYFDETLKKNWAGPEHWKVRALKQNSKILVKEKENENKIDEDGNNINFNLIGGTQQLKQDHEQHQHLASQVTQDATRTNKKSKIDFKIDFIHDIVTDDEVFRQSKKATIDIPKTAKAPAPDLNLLPDDTHFTSANLTQLFTTRKQQLKIFKKKKMNQNDIENEHEPREIADENFWAENYNKDNKIGNNDEDNNNDNAANNEGPENDFGNGLFDDDDDAFDDIPQTQEFGTQLIAAKRHRRENINYARVSKKVNIKLLKDNIWNTISDKLETTKSNDKLEFKDIVRATVEIYPPETKKDLSTSFQFISLLHLANEHGFTIESNNDHSDLYVKFN
ncbi:hypothetical protein PACTADRAFT_50200 [Pachysolen tannophilus NRRL Y-2460]|uniref:Condensin complex subunit 2 n=1 Tax=Pachysolen tannophilus NRRL Y-2460 TaxID=669874 RepID=A0A1E4TUR8_PACTA|nr:hypothetical protein PACTADRAFT_50200 [Pachysolen tannophilus NRRL Y-2460]